MFIIVEGLDCLTFYYYRVYFHKFQEINNMEFRYKYEQVPWCCKNNIDNKKNWQYETLSITLNFLEFLGHFLGTVAK